MPLSKPIQHQAATPGVQQYDLYANSERSIARAGHVVGPAAEGIICQIDGFQVWEQTDVYRLDATAYFDTADASANDVAVYVGGVKWLTVPIPAKHDLPPVTVTAFVTPNNQTISLNAVAGNASAGYGGSLILTRMKQGFRAE